MGSWSFLGALAGAHGKKAIQNLTDAIVQQDPATASEAQLQVMEADLDKVGKELANIRASATHDHQELQAVQARFDRMQAASTKLLADYNAETDPAKKKSLEDSLNGLLGTLETIKTELAQDKQNADDTDSLLAETEKVYQEKAEALRTAKSKLSQAANDLQRAKIQQEHANMAAEQAARVAGLRDNEVGGLNAAVDAMTRQAAAARADAESKKMKAQALSKADTGGLDDPNVKAALAAVSGTTGSTNQSFEERLAALKA